MSSEDGPTPAEQDSGTDFALAVRDLTLTFIRYRGVVVGDRHQVGPSDGAALGRLHTEGPQTPGELASWLNLSTGAVTELLDRLETAAFVVRGRHPTDRRKILVTLTERARHLIRNEFLAPMTRTLAPVLDRFDGPTRGHIIDAVRAAAQALEDEIAVQVAGD